MADIPIDPVYQNVIDALKREDGAAALAAAPAALAAARENPALKARVIAWMAQAEMYCGNYKAASQAARQASALAGEQGDDRAVAALRGLLAEIATRRRAAAGIQASPLPIDLPDSPVIRANAQISMGDLERGAELAREARRLAQEAGDAREEILALLALARVPAHTEEALNEAAAVADQSGDMNLVTAVARAAKAAGRPFPAKEF